LLSGLGENLCIRYVVAQVHQENFLDFEAVSGQYRS
jgi:hypothetical protein